MISSNSSRDILLEASEEEFEAEEDVCQDEPSSLSCVLSSDDDELPYPKTVQDLSNWKKSDV